MAEEIAEALFILQKANAENLSDMINEYRPAAFGKVWGNDADYNDMVKNFAAITSEDAGAGSGGAGGGGGGKPRKSANSKRS